MRILFLMTLFCYFASGAVTFAKIRSSRLPPVNQARILRACVALCIMLHTATLYSGSDSAGTHLSLGLIVSLTAWMSVILYLLLSFFKRTLNLGIILIPIGLIGLIAGYINPGQISVSSQLMHGLTWHVIIALPAYGMLCIAFAQAVLLFIQEKQLHKPSPVTQLQFLPAVETMESNLFWMIGAGFFLLTVNLLIGSLLTWQHYGKLLVFNHHIILSVLAWFSFGCLLLCGRFFGWRGESAAKWTVASFILLVLGYFGTRFVREILLG